MRRSQSLCLALLSAIALTACASDPRQLASAAPVFSKRPCATDMPAKDIVCGTVSVPENYADPGVRTIALNVVVFPALAPSSKKGAQFDFEGGPGFAVTDSATFYASDGAAYRQSRDVVLFDMRGTGASNPLRCNALEARAASHPSLPLYPPDLVADCARQLSAVADLRQYSTAAAARDIDTVRRALGYDRIDLNALSYGTTLALRYIAEYPQHVRTAVLTGTAPADKTPPAHHAVAGERGLRMLLAACAADAACARQYPDPWAELDRATAALGPDRAPVFLEKVRTLLYLPATARSVPSFIHKAASGEPVLDAQPRGGRVFADGLYLAITCSESLARMDVDQAIAQSAATRLGSYRLTRQREACKRWPVATADPKLFRSDHFDVPVLLLAGALDPVTPVEWSHEVARRFDDSKVVVFADGGHVPEGLSGLDTCMDPMILAFVAAASTQAIDASCVSTMVREPFVVP